VRRERESHCDLGWDLDAYVEQRLEKQKQRRRRKRDISTKPEEAFAID